MNRPLALILFFFEPFLAATLLLRVGGNLLTRDPETLLAVAVRVILALASVAAAIGLRARAPYAHVLTIGVLAASASFAAVQYFTRVLPTSLAPDVIALFTLLVVIHHASWIAVLAIRAGR